ncbi:MAG TPA: YtxH domain-containing protein [Gemmatimonadaceae bacterium]|nr:YtxH domain-containing protein [Gemmatimonadaceae bacterium]
MRHHDHDEQPYIVIEKHSGGVGNLLLGVLIGAGVALLFAPRSGEETRDEISRRARRAGSKVKGVAHEVTDQVVDTFEGAKARVEEQIESARSAIVTKKAQVARAMEAGREAAQQARGDLERRLAETKAAYNAGVDVARTGSVRSRTSVAPGVDDDAGI